MAADSPAGISAVEALDLLFQRNAALNADRLALADDPDRLRWNGSPPLRLTYAEAERRVERLAGAFRESGLRSGAVVALAAPNTVDTVLTLLAAFRAELAVAIVPPLWRWRDAVAYLAPLQPEALVTVGAVEGEQSASRWRGIATELGSIRLLFGIGSGVPGDFISLSELGDPPTDLAWRRGDPARQIATVTLMAAGERGAPQYHARTHAHWHAAGEALATAAPLAHGGSILLPFTLGGLTGLGAGLMPWLRSAGTLHLHHFRSLPALVHHAALERPDMVAAPGAVAPVFLSTLSQRGIPLPARTLSVWKDRHPESVPGHPSGSAMVDLTVLDDLAFIALPRRGEAPAALPLGPARPGEVLPVETRLEGRTQKAGDRQRALIGGTLSLRGQMVPSPLPMALIGGATLESGLVALSGGFVRTNTAGRLVDGPAVRPHGRGDDFLSVGGIAVAAGDLDRLYTAQEDVADAACFALTGPAGRMRIAAAVVPKPGAMIGAAAFNRGLVLAGAALHHLPDSVFTLPLIPRRADGAVDRDLVEEMTRQSYGPQRRPTREPVPAAVNG